MKNQLMYSFLAASAFALWPLLARKAGMPATTSIMIISIVTTLGIIAYTLSSATKQVLPSISSEAYPLLIIAGIINLAGNIFYSRIYMYAGNAAPYLAIAMIGIPLISYIAYYFLFKEPFTVNGVLGLIFSGIGIYFLVFRK